MNEIWGDIKIFRKSFESIREWNEWCWENRKMQNQMVYISEIQKYGYNKGYEDDSRANLINLINNIINNLQEKIYEI